MTTALRNTLTTLIISLLLAACVGGDGSTSSSQSSSSVCYAWPDTNAWSQLGCATHNQRGAVNGLGINAYVLTTSTINTSLASLGITAPGMQAVYSVTHGMIAYSTIDAAGNIVLASGFLAYPNKPVGSTSPMLSLQHGTILLNDLAPTLSIAGYDTQIGIALASYGYIVVMPDYLGYGAGSGVTSVVNNLTHPYHHAGTLASTTVDMLRATKRYLNGDYGYNGPAHNGQLFLTGYSEGGYATLATQREIETNLSTEFNITATEPAAGSYDMTTTVQAMLASSSLPTPSQVYAGFLIKSYDSVYYSAANRLSQILKTTPTDYASRVNVLYNGLHSEADIAGQLTSVTADLFNTTFRTDYLGSGETTMKGYVAANNIYNWRPSKPTRLFHGDQDDVVPYANTTTAATTMATNGSVSVTVAACAGVAPRNHVNCFVPFFVDMKTYFGLSALNL